ncbi:DHA2 family efflux MFS transporter permease subunit [Limobrevibacterium gyesilva]|uniref:DHA2 family efflux MFS transporter permease subunit n=1 Tax=Limobrevibacterium gyesilva TaxID=2991712 RepID=A0AA41YHS5_9PROT|nr:DHA2 family efflux MFS transporter permease subunit [Limobrevibacterium gyesilva]MCW3473654.1 DHA2 family efflux MFS transporter permease subunit [Limobrevibacterium gyesilva]
MDESTPAPATVPAPAAPVPAAAAESRGAVARRTRLTALIVACALFMQNLDSTVIATALPTMATAFGADPTHMNVALTSYLLSLAVFIPASGWMADRYGTRTVFRAAIAVFTLGSVLCGRADSLTFLVVARVFQGIGGAMMVPVGRLLLLRTVAKSELVAAMAWLSTPALIGPVVGPPLGGFIVTYFSWPLIFDINVPIGILGITLVTLFVEDVREPTSAKFDFRGLALSGIGLSSFMFGMETAGRGVVPPALTAAMIGVGVLCALLYWLHARRHPAPLLDFTLLRIPTFMVSVAGGTVFRIGIGAIPFLLPMMLQLGFGKSAAQSGMITFASSAGAIVMKPAAMSALRRFGFRDTLLVNAVISALLLALSAAFRPSWPLFAIYVVLLSGGFFRSLQFTAYNALAYADVPRERMSAATSLYSTIQQVSLTFGVSAGAGALVISMALSGNEAPQLPDFSWAFIAVSFISLTAAPLSLFMPRSAATEMSGHNG